MYSWVEHILLGTIRYKTDVCLISVLSLLRILEPNIELFSSKYDILRSQSVNNRMSANTERVYKGYGMVTRGVKIVPRRS